MGVKGGEAAHSEPKAETVDAAEPRVTILDAMDRSMVFTFGFSWFLLCDQSLPEPAYRTVFGARGLLSLW